ncbi:MAG: Hsp70 family protein, partial [Patescibacteria group bacterium]
VPQVEVAFDIDASGILNVKAQDKATGKEQSIKITGSTGLTDAEVEQMTKDAEAHAKEDEEARSAVEVKNQADSLIFTAEKSLKDAGDKVSAELKTEVEGKIKALKDVLPSGTKDEIETKTKELSDSLQKIGEQMSKQQQSDGEGSAASADSSGEPKEETKADESSSANASEDKPVEGEVVN